MNDTFVRQQPAVDRAQQDSQKEAGQGAARSKNGNKDRHILSDEDVMLASGWAAEVEGPDGKKRTQFPTNYNKNVVEISDPKDFVSMWLLQPHMNKIYVLRDGNTFF